MKRTLYLVITAAMLLFGAFLGVSYEENIYRLIFQGKYPVTIEMPEDSDAQAFFSYLEETADQTAVPIFYTAVTNGWSVRPLYRIYTTSLDKAFLPLPQNYPHAKLAPGDCISSEGGAYTAYVSNPGMDCEIYPFQAAAPLADPVSIFYVDTNCEAFLRALDAEGINYVVEPEDNTDVFGNMIRLFWLIGGFLFLLSIHFAYSKSREIIIRKLAGFRIGGIFHNVFSKMLLVMLADGIAAWALTGCVYAIIFGRSAFWFAIWAAPYFGLFTLCDMAVYTAGILFYLVMPHPSEIRKERPRPAVLVLTALARFVFLVACVTGVSNSYYVLMNYRLLEMQRDALQTFGDLVTVSVNSKGTELTSEHEAYAYDLICKAAGSYPTYIIDASMVEEDGILYVSESYLDLIGGVTLTDGQVLRGSGLTAGDHEMLLVPEDTEVFDNEVLTYKRGQSFPLFDPMYSALGSELTDVHLAVYSDSELREEALFLLCDQNVFISAEAEDPLTELMPLICETHMDSVVRSAFTVRDNYDDTITIIGQYLVYDIISGICDLVFLVLLAIFETTVYFEDHKRTLCIKFMHGYGSSSCRGMWIVKAATAVLLLGVTAVTGGVVFFAAFALLLDGLVFVSRMDSLRERSIVPYLKGEI